ncbi:MAG: hypothetical protein R3A10_15315 [Caldilineaceae bacterium]
MDLQKTFRCREQGRGRKLDVHQPRRRSSRDWRPGFTVDLRRSGSAAGARRRRRTGQPIPGTSLVFNLYRTLALVAWAAKATTLIKAGEFGRISGRQPGTITRAHYLRRDGQRRDRVANCQLRHPEVFTHPARRRISMGSKKR